MVRRILKVLQNKFVEIGKNTTGVCSRGEITLTLGCLGNRGFRLPMPLCEIGFRLKFLELLFQVETPFQEFADVTRVCESPTIEFYDGPGNACYFGALRFPSDSFASGNVWRLQLRIHTSALSFEAFERLKHHKDPRMRMALNFASSS